MSSEYKATLLKFIQDLQKELWKLKTKSPLLTLTNQCLGSLHLI